ncbi:MAG TPA: helix-turn-helix domain-containing protein [Candidatus Tumulicola sp.]|jgi:predicted ATPase/DNA-binding XRE family transcriptional regulator
METLPFGQMLKRFRVQAGLSQEALAERARMSAHAISSLERGARRAPYRDTVALLVDALALAASDRAAFEAAAESGRKRAPRAAVRDNDAAQSNLPAQLTSFVGRENDLAQIETLLSEYRFVTITGPGGIGKTRLAIEACAHIDYTRYDAMWFIDFAPLNDESLVFTRVATTIGVHLGDGDPARTLSASLRGRVLLILDNCEHVIGAVASLVAGLLAARARLTVLTTSRERLGIAGEHAYRLSPLPASPALELFLERAEQPVHGPDADHDVAAAICRRLDGIPLALELAAARVPVLGLSALRSRLDEHFKVLSRGSRSAPARQQTMQAAIAWSYDLLDASERALFRRLAIFAGGWRLDAAEAVCAGTGLDESGIVDALASLVEKSLVVAEDDGHLVRYVFLESTRAFAFEQLVASGERADLAAAHAKWMGSLADWAYEEYQHIAQRRWSGYALPELDNAYAALAWAHGDGNDIRLAARVLAGLRGAFVDSGGSLAEFRGWVLDALARVAPEEDPKLHARLLRALMAVSRGPELIDAAERAIALCADIGDVLGLGRSLELQASGYVEMGEVERAADAIDRALHAYRQGGFGRSAPYAVALNTRANVFHHQHRFEDAERDHAEALSIAQVGEDDWFALHVQISRAAVALTAQEFERAASLLESALAESRALHSPRYEMYALVNLAAARIALGLVENAHEAALAALRLARYRDPIGLVVSILYVASAAGLQGRLRSSARLLGYVDAWADRGYQWDPAEAACRDRLVALLQDNLDPQTLSSDIEIGRQLDEDTAAEEALRA